MHFFWRGEGVLLYTVHYGLCKNGELNLEVNKYSLPQ